MASLDRRIFGGLLCAALLAGCASQNDMEALQNQVYNDRQQNERTIQKLQDQLSEEIQKSTSPVEARQANTWAELESVRAQVARLQEQLETLSMKFNTLTHAEAGQPNLTDMTKDIRNIKIALQSQLGVDVDNGAGQTSSAPTTGQSKKAAATPTASAAPKGKPAAAPKAAPAKAARANPKYDTATALYSRADAAYKAKNYDTALQYYSEYYTNFKKSSKASDAAFWVGECAYNLKDYGKAVLAYQEVIEKFPKSGKYRPAILRQGMAFFKVGKSKAGRAVLQDLIDRYPKAPESLRARKFLKAHK